MGEEEKQEGAAAPLLPTHSYSRFVTKKMDGMTPYQIEKATTGGRDVVRKKKKPRKRSGWPQGVSDTMLQDLWRKVVRSDWNGRCAFIGYSINSPCSGTLECHHVKRRSIPHLKHCPDNGVLLCAAHHGKMKYAIWRKRLEKKIGPEKTEWLDIMEQKLFPVFLAERGQTRGEYLLSQKEYLRELLQAPGRQS